MAMSKCGLSKNDRRRLGKRSLADGEEFELEGQDGGTKRKAKKHNEAVQKDLNLKEASLIYPWMLDFRHKHRGKDFVPFYVTLQPVAVISGWVQYLCSSDFNFIYIKSS